LAICRIYDGVIKDSSQVFLRNENGEIRKNKIRDRKKIQIEEVKEDIHPQCDLKKELDVLHASEEKKENQKGEFTIVVQF